MFEVLISVACLAILTLSMAQFSSNTFSVMFRHGQQMEMADQIRFSSDLITGVVNKADYIFPSGKTLTLSVIGKPTTIINTNNSVAMLISDGEATPQYYF